MDAGTRGIIARIRIGVVLGAALGLAALAGPATAGDPLQRPAAEQKLASYRLSIDGDLYIAGDGSVSDYKLRSNEDLTPEIAALVDKQVRSWRFEPILVDGQPVVAKTRLHLSLNAEPVAGGYQLRIYGVGFGNPVRDSKKITPPKYPEAALRAGVEAEVMLVLTLDERGHVTDTAIALTSLSGTGPQRVLNQWADLFEKSATDAARHWRFSLTEEIDGHAVQTRARVPVSYRLRNIQGWRTMVPVARPGRPLPDVPDRQLAADAPTDSQPQALDSRFRLKDRVIGTVL